MPENKLLLVIPARKGSSFHRKNLHPVNGIPLIRYTLDASKISLPHDTLVTSDDPYIFDECIKYNVHCDERPENLADDLTTLDQVMHYIAVNYKYDTYILLPPTSPLRNSTHIEDAINLFNSIKCDSLVSVTEERKVIWQNTEQSYIHPLIERNHNRQAETPCYISNGAIFISRHESIIKSHKKVSGLTIPYVMSQKSSVDVHAQEDIELAEFYLK